MSRRVSVMRGLLVGLLACHPSPTREEGSTSPEPSGPDEGEVPDSPGLVQGATISFTLRPSTLARHGAEAKELALIELAIERNAMQRDPSWLGRLVDVGGPELLVYGSVVGPSIDEAVELERGLDEGRVAHVIAPHGVGTHLRLAAVEPAGSSLAEALEGLLHEQLDEDLPVVDGVCPQLQQPSLLACVAARGATATLRREDGQLVLDLLLFDYPAERAIDEEARARADSLADRTGSDYASAYAEAYARLANEDPFRTGDPTDAVRVAGMRRALEAPQASDPWLAGLHGDAAVFVDADGLDGWTWGRSLADSIERRRWRPPSADGKRRYVDPGDTPWEHTKEPRTMREATEREETEREETKQEETKQEETKQEETKQEETKQEETKREETKQEVIKGGETKREDTKQEVTKGGETKRRETKGDDRLRSGTKEAKRGGSRSRSSDEGPRSPLASIRPPDALLRGLLVQWSWQEDGRTIRLRWLPRPGREAQLDALFLAGSDTPPLPTMAALCEGTLLCARFHGGLDVEALAELSEPEAAPKLLSAFEQLSSVEALALVLIETWPHLLASLAQEAQTRGLPIGSTDTGLVAAVWADAARVDLPRFALALRGADGRRGPPPLDPPPDTMAAPPRPRSLDLGPDLDAWRLEVGRREVVVARSRPEAPPWLVVASDEDRLAWLTSRPREEVSQRGIHVALSDVSTALTELGRTTDPLWRDGSRSVWQRAEITAFVDRGRPTIDIVTHGRVATDQGGAR